MTRILEGASLIRRSDDVDDDGNIDDDDVDDNDVDDNDVDDNDDVIHRVSSSQLNLRCEATTSS